MNRDDLNKCPSCGGPADNGFDRGWPDPSPYFCTKCMEGLEEDTEEALPASSIVCQHFGAEELLSELAGEPEFKNEVRGD